MRSRWEQYCELRKIDNWCLRKSTLMTWMTLFLVGAAVLAAAFFR